MAIALSVWLVCSLLWIMRTSILVYCVGPPRFRGKPRTHYSAYLGHSVKLKCPVTGTRDPIENRTLVAWLNNNGEIIQNTKNHWSRFLIRNHKHLKIVNVKKEDAGMYNCSAYNSYGAAVLSIKLKVKSTRKPVRGMPPKFKQVPKKREMYKTGDTAKLHCHSEGDPHPNVEWFKDGESLGVKKRTSVEADGWTLNLRYLSVGDSGKYTCRVSNNVGTINRTFNIIVKARLPKLEMEETKKPEREPIFGDNVRYDCKATSAGDVKVDWIWRDVNTNKSLDLKKSKLFGTKYTTNLIKTSHNSKHYYFDSHLIIKNVSKQDEGKYICIVKNGQRSFKAIYELRVKDSFLVKTPPADDVANEETEEELSVWLVILIAISFLLSMILVGVFILYCRKQRKHLEKQYVQEYKPRDLLQQYAEPRGKPLSSCFTEMYSANERTLEQKKLSSNTPRSYPDLTADRHRNLFDSECYAQVEENCFSENSLPALHSSLFVEEKTPTCTNLSSLLDNDERQGPSSLIDSPRNKNPQRSKESIV